MVDIGEFVERVVAVAGALLDGMARRHPTAVAIKQHPGEQAWLLRFSARLALGTPPATGAGRYARRGPHPRAADR